MLESYPSFFPSPMSIWTFAEQNFNETYERKLTFVAFEKYISFLLTPPLKLCSSYKLSLMIYRRNDGFFFDLMTNMCGQFAILWMNFTELAYEKFFYCNELNILLKRHYNLIYLSHHLLWSS